jgi:hypothetical protein
MGRRAHHLEGTLVVTKKRALIGAGVAFAAVVALVLVLVLRGGPSAAVPREAISGETQLSRSAAMFADPLKAKIIVLVDRDRIDPARIGFSPDFQPYALIGVPTVEREDTGRLTHLVYTANLACVTYSCMPTAAFTRVQFDQAKVFYWPRTGGGQRTLQLPWYPLTVASRTTAADIANADPFQQPSWRVSTGPLGVTYDISPGLLRALLLAASVLLFLFALVGFAGFVRAILRRVRVPVLTRLERAVLLVERASEDDDQPAKRKALELLSRELSHTGERELALAARELAWGEETPMPAATQPLTVDVRRVVAERSNGHAR